MPRVLYADPVLFGFTNAGYESQSPVAFPPFLPHVIYFFLETLDLWRSSCKVAASITV